MPVESIRFTGEIQPGDLLDAAGVAARLGISPEAVRGALTHPERNPRAARILPAPLGRYGGAWIWRTADVLAAARSIDPPPPDPEPAPSTPAADPMAEWRSKAKRRGVAW